MLSLAEVLSVISIFPNQINHHVFFLTLQSAPIIKIAIIANPFDFSFSTIKSNVSDNVFSFAVVNHNYMRI